MSRGRLVSALVMGRRARALVAEVRGPAAELCRRHGLSGPAALQASAGIVAAALLSAHVKGEERLTVNVRSADPIFELTCDLDGDGAVRGVFRPAVLPPPRPARRVAEGARGGGGDGAPQAGALRFTGVLSVLKALGRRELYRGHSEVRDESFEAALQRYFTSSEQVDGRVRILTELDDEGQLRAAAGLLVERFPDLSPEEFAAAIDGPLQEDLEGVLTGFAFGILADEPVEPFEARDLFFRCSCSLERVRGTLLALGQAEIREILREPGYAEVTCAFCNEVYRLEAPELHAMLGQPES